MTTVDYWLTSSADDLDTADKLFATKKYHHCLFFVHLAVEKLLKAIYVSKKNDAAPPIHDLVRLAQKTETVKLDEEMIAQLAEISTFNVAARYDDYKLQFHKKATEEYATTWLNIAKTLLTKLKPYL
jgi:HEPN domain-containing protein